MTKKIHVIDDDDTFRLLVNEALTRLGYSVVESANAFEAQEVFKRQTPDMVLLDIMMPGMDGVSLCRAIRSNPATKDIPVIIISALSDSQTLNDALLFGATDYLVKPVDVKTLQEKIDKAFRQADARRRVNTP
ncbi:MAG TPA: response regulator [Elusimicrobiota bacterium]|nr:response regulator [Elusimicrobiota bacterium]